MIDKIDVVKGLNDFTLLSKPKVEPIAEGDVSFDNVVEGLLSKVNDAQVKSNDSVEAFINGDDGITMHQVMLDAKEGQMALEMATMLRNQVVELYQEVNRMQL